MILSSATKQITGYFGQSGLFLFFIADAQGRSHSVNSLFQQKFSYSPKSHSVSHCFTVEEKYREAVSDCLAQPGKPLMVSLMMTLKEGGTCWVKWEFLGIVDENNPPYIQAVGIVEELIPAALNNLAGNGALVPERYKALEQSAEGLWRLDFKKPLLISMSPDEMVAFCRENGFLAECNDNMARMYGYEKAEEIIGATMGELIDFTDAKRLEGFKNFIIKGFKPMVIETKEFDRFGNTKYFHNTMEGTVEGNQLTRIWGTQQDITEQRLAEEKIRYLAMLTENVSDIIISQDSEYKVLSWNKAAEELYGYSAEEMIGRRIAELLHFEFQGITRAEFFDQLNSNGSWRGESYVVNRFGKQITILITVTKLTDADGRVTGYVSVSKDITENRKAEQQIKQSELFYRNLISESLDGITLTDENGVISFSAPSGKEVLGFEPEEIMGRNVFEFVHPDDQEKARVAFRSELNLTYEFQFINVRLKKKSGDWLWCIVRARNMFQNPYVGRMVIYYHDDTLRKNAEDQFRQQAAILASVSDMLMITDFNLKILSWNKKAEQETGYAAEEVIGKFLGDVVRPDYGNITAKESAEILEKEGYWQGEINIINKRGVKMTILHTASYVLNEAGERVAMIGTGKDITEKRKAERLVQESENFYRNLFANSLDGVLITDENAIITFSSPSVTSIFGYESHELLGKTTFDFAHPDDVSLAITAFRKELEGRPGRTFISVRLKNKKDEWIWCIVRGHNLMKNPSIKGMLVYLYDDTMRKKTERALMESESRFRTQATILHNVTDVIITTDLQHKITSWNSVIEKITGSLFKDVKGKYLNDVLKMDYSPYTHHQVTAIVLTHGIWKGEVTFTGSDGEKRQLLYTASILNNENGEQIGILEVGRDITARKKAEAQLQESELFYRNMISHSLDGIVMTDVHGKITYCSPSALKISGYSLEELMGKNLFEFVHSGDIQVALNAFMLEINKESVLNYILLRLKHADGRWVWCTVRGHNLLENPTFKSLVIYFTDDTKRKEIEDQLRESEFRFRNLIYNLKQGVLLQDETGKMILCNTAALEMLGVTEDQLIGSTSFDPRWNVIHEDGSDFPGETHPVPQVIKTRKPVRDVVMGVYRPMTNDRVWLLVNADPVFDTDGIFHNVICSFTDITEQKRLSQELIEQEVQKQRQITQATIDGQEKERLEIGKELHDNISQHLTTTRLYLEMVKDKAQGEVSEMITLSHKNLVSIINEIRSLSQSLVPPTLGDIGLVESIHDLCDSIKKANTIGIDFYCRHFDEQLLPENLKLMLFRVTQEQVNNVIRHANATRLEIRLESDAEFITLSINDNGQGFDVQNYKKGLGFKNIANRVGLFNGKVDKESSPGSGCTLTVHVPVPGQDVETN